MAFSLVPVYSQWPVWATDADKAYHKARLALHEVMADQLGKALDEAARKIVCAERKRQSRAGGGPWPGPDGTGLSI